MTSPQKLSVVLAAVAALAASAPGAAPIELGVAGTFNIYTLGDFAGYNSSVQGAVASAGSFAASSYSVNQGNRDGIGDPGYALAVGGSLSYTNGSIRNGLYYSGGAQTFIGVGFDGAAPAATAPFSFAGVSANLRTLSQNVATLDATGSSAIRYGGMTLTGSGGPTTVFNLSGSDLASVTYFNFANLSANDTLIVNVSGTDVMLKGGWSGFGGYNVLFNFDEATSLTLDGVALYGSVLAPLATVGPGSGAIHGNVVVDNWHSNLSLNAGRYFVPADIPGFAAPIPEPGVATLLLAGLGVLICFARRPRQRPA